MPSADPESTVFELHNWKKAVDGTRETLDYRQIITVYIDLYERYRISFDDYFAAELSRLQAMQQDGLLVYDDRAIRVLPAGRLLIRNICMVFDRYLQGREEKKAFSRVI